MEKKKPIEKGKLFSPDEVKAKLKKGKKLIIMLEDDEPKAKMSDDTRKHLSGKLDRMMKEC